MSRRHFFAQQPVYRHRPVHADPVSLAIVRASLIMPAEVGKVMAPILKSHVALREGQGTHFHWVNLVTAVEIGLALEGIGALKGSRATLECAEMALKMIYDRAMRDDGTWVPVTLYPGELSALLSLVETFPQQLSKVTLGEYKRAEARASQGVVAAGGKVYKWGERV